MGEREREREREREQRGEIKTVLKEKSGNSTLY